MSLIKSKVFASINNATMHPITLMFLDANLESQFKKMHFEKSIITLRFALLTSILLYAGFGLLDKTTSPSFNMEFFSIRFLLVIPLLVLAIGITFLKSFKDYWQTVLAAAMIITGSGIIYMLHRDPNNMYYYGGMFLIFMGGYFFIRLRFFTASLTGLFIVFIYTLSYFIIPHSSSSSLLNLITGDAFFIASNIICMIGLYSSEKLERIGFYGQLLLNEKQREIENINANLEYKVDERTKQLNDAKEKAEESDKLKSAFLANMSHEIRTPMNAVIGFSTLLENNDLPNEEKKQYLNYVKSNGESLIKIIDDIIDISKIDAQQFKVKINPFNFLELIDELKQFYTNFIISKKPELKLLFKVDKNLQSNQLIHSDKIRLKQVISNLLNNAIKYTHKGKIVLKCEIIENRLQFSISDTGLGIPEKIANNIFERFYQYSDEFISRHQGTGLGLPISNEIIKLLGGTLSFESTVNIGTTFVFDIPYAIIVNALDEIPKKQVLNIEFLSHKRILIVDDEESNFVLTKRLLRETKVKMDWAENGIQALQLANDNSYDIILMDIKMPQMDGIEATERIRSTGNNVIIIMQTAFAEAPVRESAFSAGCNDFIVKPLQLDSFIKLMHQYLAN